MTNSSDQPTTLHQQVNNEVRILRGHLSDIIKHWELRTGLTVQSVKLDRDAARIIKISLTEISGV